jgi:hypothetical protein
MRKCTFCKAPYLGTPSTCSECGQSIPSTTPLYKATAIACFVLTALTVAINAEPAPDPASAFGGALGGTFVFTVFAMLLFGWTRRSRRYVPFATLVLAAVISASETARRAEEERADVDRRFVAMFTGGVAELAAGDTVPPDSPDAKLAWAVQRTLGEMSRTIRNPRRLGVEVDTIPPSAWLTPEYMATADAHPEVERHFRGYMAYTRRANEYLGRDVPGILQRNLLEAGVPEGARESVIRGFRQAYTSRNQLPVLSRAAGTAVEVHQLLASAAPRIKVDPKSGEATFENRADHERFRKLAALYDARNDSASRIVAENTARIRAQFGSAPE